ncbi:zinc finger protein 260-like [Micropterus salmoides]|uniref:zinc finger protein 260-like n=1 Tax=Micropterus salmoides TaxID=27706 RepID=UPI0018ED04C8|nr:zinc finger protein 260-like [Micropterus salmoides]
MEMSKVQVLRALVKQRLSAAAEEIFGLFERTISEYEQELCRSKEENQRHRKLLDAVFQPEVRLHRAGSPADVQQLLVSKEEVPPDQQEWSPRLDQEDPPELPHIKEEQEELWTSQEGEQLPGLEEADITKFTFTPVPVKSEEDDEEEKPQSSQLHQSQTEQMEADGEDCGGPEPARNSDPDRLVQPVSNDDSLDWTETDKSDGDWEETREPHSGLNSHNKDEAPVSRRTHITDDKQFSCSECGKRFGNKRNLKIHMKIHTGENSFSCLVCGIIFSEGGDLRRHMAVHTGEERFSFSVCDERFTLFTKQSKSHKLVGHQSVGLEPERNSDPERLLQPADSGLKVEISDGWKKARGPQSSLNFLKNNKAPASKVRRNAGGKSFRCAECGRLFSQKSNLNTHMKIHTGEKPFSCSFCGKQFREKGNMRQHMVVHTGEKPFSCSVCDQRFSWRRQLKKHKCVGEAAAGNERPSSS